jgi:hypothetical protein
VLFYNWLGDFIVPRSSWINIVEELPAPRQSSVRPTGRVAVAAAVLHFRPGAARLP